VNQSNWSHEASYKKRVFCHFSIWSLF